MIMNESGVVVSRVLCHIYHIYHIHHTSHIYHTIVFNANTIVVVFMTLYHPYTRKNHKNMNIHTLTHQTNVIPLFQGFFLFLLSILAGYFTPSAPIHKLLQGNAKYVLLFCLLFFTINFSHGQEHPHTQLWETTQLFLFFIAFEHLPLWSASLVLLGCLAYLYSTSWVEYLMHTMPAKLSPQERMARMKELVPWQNQQQGILYAVGAVMALGVLGSLWHEKRFSFQ